MSENATPDVLERLEEASHEAMFDIRLTDQFRALLADCGEEIEKLRDQVEDLTTWRPIATAPKDGTEILGFGHWAGEIHGPDPRCPPCRAIISWSGGRSDHPGYDWDVLGGDAYGCWLKATHWMPLTEPPKAD